LDIEFTSPTDITDDNALIEGLRRTPGTILVTVDTGRAGSNDVLGGSSGQAIARVRVASAVLRVDPGGTYRRFDFSDGGLPTLAVSAAAAVQPGFRLSELGRPPVWIDYAGGPGTVPSVSMLALLHGRVPPREVRGRIVLIGVTDPRAFDLHSFSVLTSRRMTGAEIEANAIETATEHAPLRDASGWVAMLLTLAAIVLAPVAAIRRRMWVGTSILLAALIAYPA